MHNNHCDDLQQPSCYWLLDDSLHTLNVTAKVLRNPFFVVKFEKFSKFVVEFIKSKKMGNLIYRVNRNVKHHPSWAQDAVLYEFNTRQFTPEGTFRAAMEHLPRLKALGADILWMMPIFPIGKERRKGELGSYYSIADYCAINPEFGTLEDFTAFVQRAHELGMYIIVDWVANHTSRDAKWVESHPEWYEWDAIRQEITTPFDWDDTAKLNFDNTFMRDEMLASMRFWVEQIGIDGFRCDMAMLVPLDFWRRATSELSEVVANQGRELYMLAEAEGAEFHTAFDATYCWELHHILNKIAQGQADAYTLGERLAYENTLYDASALRMHFTSNHDENTWNGSAPTRLGGATSALAALTFMLSGTPLIYSGQEVGNSKSLAFFDKDEIEWSASEQAQKMTKLYEDLCALKHSHPALLGGEMGGDIIGVDNSLPWQVFAIKRKVGERVVIALFNLSGNGADTAFYDEDFSGTYKVLGEQEEAHLTNGSHFYLPAWGFFVYYK